MIRLVYHGPPATKKTSQQIAHSGSRVLVLPSKAYRELLRTAVPELRAQHRSLPLARAVSIAARFYLAPRQRPDLSGLFEAAGDILQAAGVLANDYWIVSWDGSRRIRDGSEPRTEVDIEVAS